MSYLFYDLQKNFRLFTRAFCVLIVWDICKLVTDISARLIKWIETWQFLFVTSFYETFLFGVSKPFSDTEQVETRFLSVLIITMYEFDSLKP